jgi:hypothetical protein
MLGNKDGEAYVALGRHAVVYRGPWVISIAVFIVSIERLQANQGLISASGV